MPGTRTAPLFTAAPNFRRITLSLVDASGDYWSENLLVDIAEAAADIETWIAGYQASTNASLYSITDELIRAGDPDPDQAVAAFRGGIENGINLSFRNTAMASTYVTRVIAPVAATMQGNQDIPLLTVVPLSTMIVAELVIKPGFDLQTAQYTVHRERKNNVKIRV